MGATHSHARRRLVAGAARSYGETDRWRGQNLPPAPALSQRKRGLNVKE